MSSVSFGIEWERIGTMRISQSYSENPKNEDYFNDSSESNSRFNWRESWSCDLSENWRSEFHVYNLITGASDKQSAARINVISNGEANRSTHLERRWHNSAHLDGFLTIDRLALKGDIGPLHVAAGRLPITLSTMTIFNPNDFFAPFRPHNFYREYKPGVDAATAAIGIGDMAQLSAIGVAGYESEVFLAFDGLNRDQRFSFERSSALARLTFLVGGLELGLLGGKYGFYSLAGYSLQGEFGAFGVRAEGHQKKHRREDQASAEVAASLEYRPSDLLFLQLEAFFHGEGFDTVSEYSSVDEQTEEGIYFLGQQYSSLAVVYSVTALTQMKLLSIFNFTDQSALPALNITHSTSEESELSATFVRPRGKGPDENGLRSEYGSYPTLLSFAAKTYF